MPARMNTTQPLVSIVTPVYNGAEFLSECIESVLNQTYQNWDYTIVDNCSTDGTVEIARRYAARDPRIRVVQNDQFLTVIPNHNLALRQISPESKYCKMVFADDWIFPQCVEEMVAIAEEYPSVGIVGCYGLQGDQVAWTGLPYPSHCISGREVCRRRFLEELFVFGAATALLFRSDVVRGQNPFYNEANLHADIESCVVVLKTWNFGFVHQVLCYSRVRSGSTSDYASVMATYKAGFLYELLTHGPDFLSQEEFESRKDRVLDEYYNFLAVSLFFKHDSKFWQYHKKKLSEMGIGLNRSRLAWAVLRRLGSAVLNPMQTSKKLLEHVGSTNQKVEKSAKQAGYRLVSKTTR
jgi:glycosyltransferase involved in cell wall biosynthesis